MVDAANHLLGHMRHDLHAFPLVFKVAFLLDDGLVHTPRGHVVLTGDVLIQKPFIVSNILIGLVTIDGHEYLAVLHRIHGSGVHVHIRVDLHGAYAVAFCLQEPA